MKLLLLRKNGFEFEIASNEGAFEAEENEWVPAPEIDVLIHCQNGRKALKLEHDDEPGRPTDYALMAA